MAIVEFKEVSRVYRNGDHEQRALDRVNLQLEEGKFIVILGPSGAGKSTLLNLLGGLDNPTEGTITVKGRASARINAEAPGKAVFRGPVTGLLPTDVFI